MRFTSAANSILILKIISWLTLLISILSFFSALNEETYGKFFSSDTVGLPSIYKDLAEDQGSLKDWYFAAAPTLFPDYLLYFLLQTAGHFKITTAMFAYSVLQTLILVVLLALVFKKVVPANLRPFSWLVPLLFSTFFIEAFYCSKDVFIPILIGQFSYHTGSFINALIALLIFLSDFSKKKILAFLFLFSALAAFSDLLYLPMFTFPFFFTELFLLKKEKIKTSLLNIVSVLSGSVFGILIYRFVASAGVTHFMAPHKIYAFSEILPSLEYFSSQMAWYISIPGPRSVFFLTALLAVPALTIFLFMRRKTLEAPLKYFLIFSLVFSLCVIFAPIVNGNYTGLDTLRYNLAAFLLFTNVLAVFISWLINAKIRKPAAKTVFSFFATSLFLVVVISGFNKKGFRDYFSYKPQIVREIDQICKDNHLENGVSEYWNAKLFTIFSDHDIKLRAVFPNVNINELGASVNWYHQKDFDFIVANNLDAGIISSTFKIRDTLQTPNFTILRVEKFTYPENKVSPDNLSK